MRRQAALVGLMGLMATVAACGTLPWTEGPSRSACGPQFAPEARLEWSGRGDPVALGLLDATHPAEEADIYVTAAKADSASDDPGIRSFCAVSDAGVTIAEVPRGWRSP